MQAVLYTGTGATQTISGLNFQPDFVWIKSRSAATDHKLTDSVRGVTKALISDSTAAESTDTNGVTAFTSNGFTIGSDSVYNANGATYVAWCWKANGAAVTNTAGSITSSVSANTTSGFSVVTYTGTNNAGTLGHGLNATPSMIIVKARGDTQNWAVYHVSTGNTGGCVLNLTVANNTTNSGWWNNTSPTSSVFNVGGSTGSDWYTTNKPSIGYVAYCFAAIPGYSAFGSYTGNGSTDGPFVYFGFRPRFILIKDSSNVDNWQIFDTSRVPYNASGHWLWPDRSVAEADYSSTYPFDMLSNGLKLRNASYPNTSGHTYIYAAFAENPFQNALAR